MRVTTWNVNSIRARVGRVDAWVEHRRPDVILLQETKCTDEDFPTSTLAALGYEVSHWGEDQWNGVAVASRVGLDDVVRGFPQRGDAPAAPRLISATCAGVRVHSVYVPNGRELNDPQYLYKLIFLERLLGLVESGRPTVLAGDFNVAPADIDVYDPARFRGQTHTSREERAAIAAIERAGLRDVTREHHLGPGIYTWWNYRPQMFSSNRGLRIDLALCSDDVADRVTAVEIDTEERAGHRPRDHAPVTIEFDLAE